MVMSFSEMDPDSFKSHINEVFKPPPSLANTYQQWIEDMILKNMSFNTIYTYAQTISEFLNYINKSPQEITEADIKAYSSYLTSQGKSPSSVLIYLIRISSFLKHFNNRLNVYKYAPKKERKIPEYITADELDKFLNAIDEDVLDADEPDPSLAVMRFKALFTLLADTGLRATEACDLSKMDIDFAERLVIVRKGKRNKYRTVPATARVLNLLKSYWDMRTDKLPFAFEYKGHKLDRMVVWRFTKKIAHKAGIDVRTRTHGPSIHPHMFRHTFATLELKRLIKSGSGRMDAVLLIKEALGHADLSTTLIYLTILGEDVRDMMGR